MSREIDERVVEMRFNNANFEQNAAKTMSTLDKLKAKLNFNGMAKSVETFGNATEVNMANIAQTTDKVQASFSALQVVAMTTLANITNSALNTGKALVKSLSVDQITAGFSKYNEETASVQTLINATGKSIDQVEEYLSELRWFSDETSYGFTEMTKALGMMTSTGGDIEKLIPMIEGVANATAYAGKGTAEFSRAIYNLSQSYGTGALQLIDWKSLEQAGVGSKQLKQTLIDVAEEMGKIQKGQVTVANFSDTLQKKWADTEVMEAGFGRFAEMTQKAYEMVQNGMVETASQAYEILGKEFSDFRIAAARSAQEAKSFSEAIEATKDAVSSKWAETFKIVIGNYEEAKELWTDVANELYEVFAASSDARNEMLQGWKDLGGRKILIETLAEAYRNLKEAITPLKKAFEEMFPPMTSQRLLDLTNGFKKFVEQLKISEETAYTLKVAMKVLLVPVKLLFETMKLGISITAQLIVTLFKIGDAFLSLFSKASPLDGLLKRIFGEERYIRIAKSTNDIMSRMSKTFSTLGSKLSGLIPKVNKTAKSFEVFEKIEAYFKPLTDKILDQVVLGFEKLSKINFSSIKDFGKNILSDIQKKLKSISDFFSPLTSAIKRLFSEFENYTIEDRLIILRDAIVDIKNQIMSFLKGDSFSEVFGDTSEKSEKLKDSLKKLGDAITDFVSKLSPAKILVFSFGTALTGVMFTLNNTLKSFGNLANSANTVIKTLLVSAKPSKITEIAKALTILAGALAIISLVKPENLKQATIAMMEMMAAFTIMTGVIGVLDKKLLDAKSFAKVTSAMMSMSLAILSLSVALNALSKVDMDMALVGKVAAIGTLMFALSGAMNVMSKVNVDLSKNALFILAFAFSISSIVKTLEKLKDVDYRSIIGGLGSIVVMMGVLASISSIASKTKFGSATGVMVMCFNLLIITEVLKKLAKVDSGQLIEGLVGLIPIFVTLSTLAKISNKAGENMLKAGVGIAAMSASILILAEGIKVIGSLDKDQVVKGTAAIVALFAAFGVITALSKFSGEHATKAGKAIMAMSASILLLSLAIKYIGSLDADVIVKGTLAVESMLVLFAAVIAVGTKAKQGTGAIVAVSAALGILISALVLLTLLPSDEVLESAKALSMIMTSLGVALIGFAKVTETFKKIKIGDAVKQIAALGVFMSALVGVVKLLTLIDGDDSILQKATSMSVILTTAIGAFYILSRTKTSDYAELTVKLLGLTSAMYATTGVIAILAKIPVDETIAQKATALSEVLLASSAAIGILSAVKLNPVTAATAIVALGVVMVELGALLELAGYVMSDEKARQFANDGVIFFGKIGDALGAFSGGIIKAVSEAVKEIVGGRVGQKLTQFMTDIQPFIEMASNINFSVVTGVAAVVSAITLLTGAGFINGIMTLFGGGIGLAVIGKELADFADPIKKFANATSGIPKDVVESSSRAAEAIAALLTAIPKEGGALSLITGKVKLDSFGTQVTTLAEGIKKFSDEVSKDGGISTEAVENAKNAAEILLTLYDKLPKTGGWMQTVFGEADLGVFGEQINKFGSALLGYSNTITSGNGIDKKAVENSANAASLLANLYSKLSPTGGAWQSIFGEKNLDTFSFSLESFGFALKGYSDVITSGNGIDKKAVENSSNAAQILIDLQSKLGTTGGVWQNIFGTKDLGTFSTNLISLGDALVSYSEKISTINLNAIKSSVDSIILLTSMDIGEKTVLSIQAGISKQVAQLEATIKSMASQTVTKAKEAFGITKLYSEKFKTIGEQIIAGLVKGIDSKSSNAINAMTRVGEDLIRAIQTKLLIQSPSKVMRDEVGRYIVMGIAEGISSNTSAEEAAEKKASNITNAFKTAFDKLDLRTTTLDLEDQLWQALNPNASEAKLQNRQKKLLDEKLKIQAEAVRNAEAEYQTTIQVLGETSDQAKQAYNKLLQEKIEMAQLAQQLAGERKSVAEDAQVAYARLMGENKEDLMKMGFTEEQIQSWAEEMSGYTLGAVKEAMENTLDTAMAEGDIQGIMQAYLDPIPEVVVKAVDTGIQNGSQAARSGGQKIGNNLAGGVKDGLDAEKEGIGETLKSLLSGDTSVEEIKKDFSGSASAIVDALAGTIAEKGSGFIKNVEGLATSAIGVFNETLDVNSPSKEFKKSGNSIVEGLVLGIDENQNQAETKMSNLASTMLKSMESNSKQFEENGKNLSTQVINGFVKGVEQGKSNAIKSIVKLAADAYNAAKKELQIASPSKKFEQLGEYVTLGFARGITNESGRVADASDTLVNATLDKTASAILHANKIIEDQKYSPIIRPVVDLQQVQDTMETLDNTYSTNLAAKVESGTKKKAAKSPVSYNPMVYRDNYGLNAGKGGKYSFSNIGSGKNVDKSGNIIFNQYNSSPKALSSSTIYRNTKNQFSSVANKIRSSKSVAKMSTK